MSNLSHKDVTYIGKETPFVDRIYRTKLTWGPGQTRSLPPEIADRFLRHTDVFVEGLPKPAKAAEATHADAPKTESTSTDTPVSADASKQDDTAELLAKAKDDEDAQRERENARFELLDRIESMDKASLTDFALTHYKQKLPQNLGVEKMRDRVRGFIDQYGAP